MTAKRINNEFDWMRPHLNNGGFYSPIPDLNNLNVDYLVTLGTNSFMNESATKILPGIEMRIESQKKLIKKLSKYYDDIPFTENKTQNCDYYFENSNYSYGDAITYYSIIRYLKPKRIVEIGSGFSSTVSLDINRLFFSNNIRQSFIEPYPDLLNSLNTFGLPSSATILDNVLQRVDISIFRELKRNDILFIDSSHVSKFGSDVNKIIFEILPIINKGVWIHFHDVFPGFEYPREWVLDGRFWNESYLLRAFLQYNSSFRVELSTPVIGVTCYDYLKINMPLFLKNTGGGLWISKIK
jgi:hypothetical protein